MHLLWQMDRFKEICWGGEQWLMPIILASQEVKIGRTSISVQHRQKSSRDPISTKKSWAWWCMHVTLAKQEA
jgi:hypothetical protein